MASEWGREALRSNCTNSLCVILDLFPETDYIITLKTCELSEQFWVPETSQIHRSVVRESCPDKAVKGNILVPSQYRLADSRLVWNLKIHCISCHICGAANTIHGEICGSLRSLEMLSQSWHPWYRCRHFLGHQVLESQTPALRQVDPDCFKKLNVQYSCKISRLSHEICIFKTCNNFDQKDESFTSYG